MGREDASVDKNRDGLKESNMARVKRNGWGTKAQWVAIVIVLISAALAVGGMITTLSNHEDRLDKNEPKIEAVGDAVIKIQSDVSWIRKGIEDLKARP